MNAILAGAVVISPLVLYIVAAAKLGKIEDYHVFLYPSNRISPSVFANSSTAYNFQVASLSFFILLGYLSPVGGIINTVFWGAGIFLFRRYVNKLDYFFGREVTLSAYLSSLYHNPRIRKISSIVVFAAFISLLLAELVFGSYIFLAFGIDEFTASFLPFLIVIFILVYYRIGGKLTVLVTDGIQLLVAYFGIFITIAWILSSIIISSDQNRTIAMIISIVIGFAVFVNWFVFRLQNKTHPTEIIEKLLYFLFLLTWVSAFIFALLQIPYATYPTHLIETTKEGIGNFQWYDYLSAFILTPLFWQFGDLTNWHRLGALQVTRKHVKAKDIDSVKTGFLRYGIQSPVTILLALCIGISLHYIEQPFDVAQAEYALMEIPSYLMQVSSFGIFVAAMFIVAVVAILLSTVDSFLASSVFIFIYDIHPTTSTQIDRDFSQQDEVTQLSNNHKNPYIIRTAKFYAALITFGGLSIYTLLKVFEVDILALLFFGFSIPLSFVPSVLVALSGKHENLASIAYWSILSGFIAGVGLFFAAQFFDGLSYLPPLAALTGSTLIFLFHWIKNF